MVRGRKREGGRGKEGRKEAEERELGRESEEEGAREGNPEEEREEKGEAGHTPPVSNKLQLEPAGFQLA